MTETKPHVDGFLPRTDDEKRESVVFAARHAYVTQRFVLVGTNEEPPGLVDPFNLQQGVEPLMSPAERRELWRDVLPPAWSDAQVDQYQLKHWCGAFALRCIKRAGLADGVFWRDAVGFAEPEHMPRVKVPKPGDVAWFLHNQHYAIVEGVRGNLFDSIDGNQGVTMGRPCIKLHTGRPLSSAAVFYSLENFLKDSQ